MPSNQCRCNNLPSSIFEWHGNITSMKMISIPPGLVIRLHTFICLLSIFIICVYQIINIATPFYSFQICKHQASAMSLIRNFVHVICFFATIFLVMVDGSGSWCTDGCGGGAGGAGADGGGGVCGSNMNRRYTCFKRIENIICVDTKSWISWNSFAIIAGWNIFLYHLSRSLTPFLHFFLLSLFSGDSILKFNEFSETRY